VPGYWYWIASKKSGIDIEIRTARATSISGVVSSEKSRAVRLDTSVPVIYKSRKGLPSLWICVLAKSAKVYISLATVKYSAMIDLSHV